VQPHSFSTAKELNVQKGIANALQSKFQRYLFSLLQRFRQSTLRLVVLEILYFPRRIAAVITDPWLRYGNTLYVPSRDRSIGNLAEENTHSRACIYRIQELERTHRWVGPLDLEIAAQMHRQGALWALDTFGKGKQSTEQIQPFVNPAI
jgi:hypothetical protein